MFRRFVHPATPEGLIEKYEEDSLELKQGQQWMSLLSFLS